MTIFRAHNGKAESTSSRPCQPPDCLVDMTSTAATSCRPWSGRRPRLVIRAWRRPWLGCARDIFQSRDQLLQEIVFLLLTTDRTRG
jgi:hypothetical protein